MKELFINLVMVMALIVGPILFGVASGFDMYESRESIVWALAGGVISTTLGFLFGAIFIVAFVGPEG